MSRAKAPSRKPAQSRKRPVPKANQKAEPFLTSKRLNIVFCVLLSAITIGLYSPVMGHSFLVLDDRDYVTANAHIHDGLRWSTIKWAFTATAAANWHPLTWLSHALDCQLFALNPTGHHLDSVLIHAVNAALLFLLLTWLTNRRGPSLLVAALFALHPINVESVAWIAERKNVLSTFFFFLTIAAYAWYAHKPDWKRYLLMSSIFAAGLMAKPMLVTLPFVLLLLDYWPLERVQFDSPTSNTGSPGGIPRMAVPKLLLEKIPLLFLSAASSWITLHAQRLVVRTFAELSFTARIENAVVAYGLYLWKMFWPAHLAFYPYPVVALPAWQWILSGLVLIGITTLVVVFRRKTYLPVGWCWFLGTLVPVIGLVQVGEASMADRYAYVPLIGIFIMIAWGLADLADVKGVDTVWRVIPALCVLVALGCVTYRQISFWQSDYDLWSHTLAIEESPFAHNAVAMALINPDSEMTQTELEDFGSLQNRIDEARRHFERALELRELTPQKEDVYLSDTARTLNNLGNLDRIQNRMDEARKRNDHALEIYRQLARENPDVYLPYMAGALNNLGSINRQQNRMDEARRQYEEALQIDRQLVKGNAAKYLPNTAMTLNELGFLDASQNRINEAAQDFQEALQIDRQLAEQSPSVYLIDLATTLTNFGRLDATQKKTDEARPYYEEALNIYRQLALQNPAVYEPDLAMTLENLGQVDQIENRFNEARSDYEEALSVLQKLSRGDQRYATESVRLEAILEELEKKASSK
jgi:protein O-mannosyl-transferase